LTAARNILLSSADKEIKQNDSESKYQILFTTKAEPGIASYTPNGSNVLVDTGQIVINFSQEIKNLPDCC